MPGYSKGWADGLCHPLWPRWFILARAISPLSPNPSHHPLTMRQWQQLPKWPLCLCSCFPKSMVYTVTRVNFKNHASWYYITPLLSIATVALCSQESVIQAPYWACEAPCDLAPLAPGLTVPPCCLPALPWTSFLARLLICWSLCLAHSSL